MEPRPPSPIAGLAPQLAGLYQVNLTIPTGLTAGDNYLDIAGPDSYTSEVLISIGGSRRGRFRRAHASTAKARRPPPRIGKALVSHLMRMLPRHAEFRCPTQ